MEQGQEQRQLCQDKVLGRSQDKQVGVSLKVGVVLQASSQRHLQEMMQKGDKMVELHPCRLDLVAMQEKQVQKAGAEEDVAREEELQASAP